MPLISPGAALAFANNWVEAWNRHDLDAVLKHYAPNFEFCSPYIVDFAAEASGCLCGQEAIRRYWETGLARIPNLHFRLIDVLAGVNSITVYYAGHRGAVAEVFHFNSAGKVIQAHACYSVLPAESQGGIDA